MDNKYQDSFARKIKDEAMFLSMSKGKLSQLIDIVKNDDRFVIHIRNNYFNIYYHSGSVIKVGPQSITVDKNYFNSDKYKGKYKEVVELYKEGNYVDFLNTMIDVMESYWDALFFAKHPKNMKRLEDEGDVQQQISVNNKFGKSDFTVIDLEYQISSALSNPLRYDGTSPFPVKKRQEDGTYKIVPKTQPRFDIIAIHNGELYIIELKKGTNAIRHHAGIHDHIDSFIHTIGKNTETKQLFVDEMRALLKQKQVLGLVDKRVDIISNEIQFCIAYSYKNPKEKRNKEAESVRTVRDTICCGIDPSKYSIIYLEPNEYTLLLK